MAKRRMKENLKNYKTVERENIPYRSVDERLKDYKFIYQEYSDEMIKLQASRCQDCGVPFCHGFGCPLANKIPEWNELVYKGKWEEACELLHDTNNFPEITGRVCPALCEESCTLNVGMQPVSIRDIEMTIVERGFKEGWIKAEKPLVSLNKKIAVVGSGPAGLTASQELVRKGYQVTLFEKDNKVGGFLRYGIPDFKLEKDIIDRRVNLMIEEGLVIKTGVTVGEDITVEQLKKDFDAVVLTGGSRDPRNLPVEGRDLDGVYFATDFLTQTNKRNGNEAIGDTPISAEGKDVLVIGGGDTGADCVGTSKRQGAKSVTQIEILPKPPEERADETPWPMYAKKLRTSSSHKEGCERKWCIATKKINGDSGKVTSVDAVEVEWTKDADGRWVMNEKKGSEFKIKADLILLAMGFVHPVHDKLLEGLDVEYDQRGNVKTSEFGFGKTSVDGVYSAGDMSRGASLVVWAIHYGREIASMVDADLR